MTALQMCWIIKVGVTFVHLLLWKTSEMQLDEDPPCDKMWKICLAVALTGHGVDWIAW